MKRLAAAAATAVLLASCGAPLPPTPSIGEPAPAPSTTPTPVQAVTPAPIVDGTPAIVLEPPEFVSSPTPTRISLPLPQERLILEAPGPGSHVVSPVRVAGWGGPSAQGKIFVRLIGEQGQEIARTTTFLLAPEDAAGLFVVTVPFAMSGVAEAGLVEVSFNAPGTSRLEHLATRPVVFLSVGPPRIETNLEAAEKLTIFSPRPDQVVAGGSLIVRGAAWLDEDLPLRIEVIDRGGAVIASTDVEVQEPVVGELGTFEAVLTYQVPFAQYVRLALAERGLTPPALRHYTSIRLYLQP